MRCYKSIDSLPLWNYAKVIETNDLRYLLILDYYDDLPKYEVDPAIWEALMFEYFEKQDSIKSRTYVKNMASLMLRRKEALLLSDCIFCLRYKPDDELILIIEKILKKYNRLYKFDKTNYVKSVLEADRQCKGLVSTYELKQREFDAKNKPKSGQKMDVYKIIDALQRHNHILINPKEITVRQFSAMVQSMNEQITKENGRREIGNRRIR